METRKKSRPPSIIGGEAEGAVATANHHGVDSECAQCREQETIDTRVRFAQVSRRADGCGDRIRDLARVQDRASPRGAADDTDATLAKERQSIPATRCLIASQRERRFAPRIHAERPQL